MVSNPAMDASAAGDAAISPVYAELLCAALVTQKTDLSR